MRRGPFLRSEVNMKGIGQLLGFLLLILPLLVWEWLKSVFGGRSSDRRK